MATRGYFELATRGHFFTATDTPGAVAGLKREEAIDLIEHVQGLQSRLDRLRDELRRLAESD